MNSHIFKSVSDFLVQSHIKVPNSWILSKISNEPRSLQQIKNNVYHDWLCSDLSEFRIPTLPPNFKNLRSTVTTCSYCLQVQWVRDISTSSYSQIMKIMKTENSNNSVSEDSKDKSWEPQATRMLYLELTDGLQTINAIEYQPLRNFSIDISPGCKVLIHSGILSRQGILLLSSDKIELLGGKVEGLLSTNSTLSIIRGTLSLDSNRICGLENMNKEISNSKAISGHSPLNGSSEQSSTHESLHRKTGPNASIRKYLRPTLEHTDRNIQISTITSTKDDVDMLLESDLECFNEDFILELECDTPSSSSAKKRKIDFQLLDDPTDNLKPFSYLIDIKSHKGTSMIIKGFILTLTSKLSSDENVWELRVKVNDGTASVDAFVHSQLLNDLIGITAEEYNIKKTRAKTDISCRNEIIQSVTKCQQLLVSFSGLMELKLVPNGIPTIISFNEVTQDVLNYFKNIYKELN